MSKHDTVNGIRCFILRVENPNSVTLRIEVFGQKNLDTGSNFFIDAVEDDRADFSDEVDVRFGELESEPFFERLQVDCQGSFGGVAFDVHSQPLRVFVGHRVGRLERYATPLQDYELFVDPFGFSFVR